MNEYYSKPEHVHDGTSKEELKQQLEKVNQILKETVEKNKEKNEILGNINYGKIVVNEANQPYFNSRPTEALSFIKNEAERLIAEGKNFLKKVKETKQVNIELANNSYYAHVSTTDSNKKYHRYYFPQFEDILSDLKIKDDDLKGKDGEYNDELHYKLVANFLKQKGIETQFVDLEEDENE